MKKCQQEAETLCMEWDIHAMHWGIDNPFKPANVAGD